MANKHTHRAAVVAALYEILKTNDLSGYTYQEIADAIGYDCRASAWRAIHQAKTIDRLVNQIKRKLEILN